MFDQGHSAECTGMHEVEVDAGPRRTVNVKRMVTDSYGHPIILEDVDGTQYNWRHIISIKRLPESYAESIRKQYAETMATYPTPHFPPPPAPPPNSGKVSGRPNPGIVGG